MNKAMIGHPPAGSRLLEARRFTRSGAEDRVEPIAAEMPIALSFNGQSFAVMLATPADLEDFARGFASTEDVVGSIDEIRAIEVVAERRGIEVRVTIPEARAAALAARRRSLAGRSGCGLCGVDRFSEALRPVEAIEPTVPVTPDAVRRAVASLADLQILNARVGAVHAAAFADGEGRIRLLREDIGRHNALDKVIGGLAAAALEPSTGFVLVSSRCSYEMVHKTAAARIGLIAAVSAPTSLAIELAEKVGVCLVGFAREERFTVYATPSGVAEASRA